MPTTLDPRRIVALQEQDLATIREEIQSSCQYLGHALGFPVELLVAGANNAVFLAENSLVTADYTISEDGEQIVYDNIEIHEDCGDPTKLAKASELVEAIMNDDLEAADRAWPVFESSHVQDFLSRQRLDQLAEAISFDNPAKVGIRPTEINESIVASRGYFRTSNFTGLEKLEALRTRIQEAIDEAIDSEEPLGEASYYTARGGRKAPKRVKIDRKKRRLSKKFARKNRAALIRRLKVARRKLKKMFRKPAFRRKMARVRRLNDARETEQMRTLLRETVSEEPNIAFLTIPEIAEQVEEAFKMEGVKGYTQQTVQETAMALAMVSRRYYPESRRYITEAALSFLPPSYNTPSDDPFESLEHINCVLWEKVAEQEGNKEEIIKIIHDMVSSLVDTISDDLESADSEDEESKEMKEVLEKLQGYRDELAGFDENPDEANLDKVKSILDYVAGLMDLEEDEEEDEEDKSSEDPDDDDDTDDDNEDENPDDDEDEDEDPDDDDPDDAGASKVEGSCAEKMGCSSDKKAKKKTYKMGEKEYGIKEAVKTPPTNKAKQTHEKDQDPGFYGADGKANTAAQKKDSSEAPYDEALALKLFGDGGSLPKSEARGEQGDHPVSADQDRNPLLEGYSLTRSASDALKSLMKALGNDGLEGRRSDSSGLGSNEWKRGKDSYFYELERENQEDGGIKGEVIKGSKSIGSFHIDGNGYIVKFPGASKEVIEKVNKGKERYKASVVTTEGKKLSVPDQHRKKIAIRTLQMNDVAVNMLNAVSQTGGMTKEQARQYLKSIGYNDKKIAKLEENLVINEEEEVYVPEKARQAVKRWANSVGAVIQFDKDGKARIPGQHMQAFKANFSR